ncbi:Fe(3+) ABC transporter substrate-binding protein [Rhodalgimonas zhirmunskyi]|uniref:Fe(3+) ABC transporter substrate-binding protein n=1 Tax=Rhodalgimonas zhirmunskyi TaxID=2964767 RepID=A0AAJ1U8F9_9RHOB|nr:Fe(3+) ABC transporter substrate-binding protein [Rhodoalgimonas zhirmunskyi]MDQ2095545.1 Fe(3+) ABC transporter substrate-binding protein [Rhodoalgimonas zhirmunskyi]
MTISLRSLILSTALLVPGVAAAAELNLYTSREPGLVAPLLEAFTEETGVTVNTVFLKDGLAERVQAEGASSPADVLMAVDAGNMNDFVEMGLTQPITSKAVLAAVPTALHGPDDQWVALSMRARVVYAAKDLDISSITYEDLADPKWKGKLCIRSGQHPYNTALFAAYLAHHGAEATETWLAGMKDNLARTPGGGDRDGAKDILGGICDIAVANSYYVGKMRTNEKDPQQKEWGEAIKVLLPTFEDGGTHVNISGAAIAKHAPNHAEAVKLLEFLTSDDAQKLYAEANFEYPVKAGADLSPIVASFGDLKIDSLPLSEVVAGRKQVSNMVDKVGFNN